MSYEFNIMKQDGTPAFDVRSQTKFLPVPFETRHRFMNSRFENGEYVTETVFEGTWAEAKATGLKWGSSRNLDGEKVTAWYASPEARNPLYDPHAEISNMANGNFSEFMYTVLDAPGEYMPDSKMPLDRVIKRLTLWLAQFPAEPRDHYTDDEYWELMNSGQEFYLSQRAKDMLEWAYRGQALGGTQLVWG